MDGLGIDPRTFRMLSERSTTELRAPVDVTVTSEHILVVAGDSVCGGWACWRPHSKERAGCFPGSSREPGYSCEPVFAGSWPAGGWLSCQINPPACRPQVAPKVKDLPHARPRFMKSGIDRGRGGDGAGQNCKLYLMTPQNIEIQGNPVPAEVLH